MRCLACRLLRCCVRSALWALGGFDRISSSEQNHKSVCVSFWTRSACLDVDGGRRPRKRRAGSRRACARAPARLHGPCIRLFSRMRSTWAGQHAPQSQAAQLPPQAAVSSAVSLRAEARPSLLSPARTGLEEAQASGARDREARSLADAVAFAAPHRRGMCFAASAVLVLVLGASATASLTSALAGYGKRKRTGPLALTRGAGGWVAGFLVRDGRYMIYTIKKNL